MYVNLFTPSKVQWADGSGHYALTQETKYPFANTVSMRVSASKSADFVIYVRIPSWTSNPVLSINGKRASEPIQPGTFASIKRTWSDGDRVELELPMPLRIETVDTNHPNLVALLRGPLVLFAIADSQPSFDRNALLQASAASASGGDWVAKSADGSEITMRPFMNIDKESYSTYVLLKA